MAREERDEKGETVSDDEEKTGSHPWFPYSSSKEGESPHLPPDSVSWLPNQKRPPSEMTEIEGGIVESGSL